MCYTTVVTNSCLIGLKTPSTGGKSYLPLLPSQLLRACEVMGRRNESTIASFIAQHHFYNMLNLIIPTCKCSSDHSSKKLLHTTETITEKTAAGHSSVINGSWGVQPRWINLHQLLNLQLREPHGRGCRKIERVRRPRSQL